MTVPDHMSKPFKKPLASTEVSTHGTAAGWCSPSVSNAWRRDGSPYKRLEDHGFIWHSIRDGAMTLHRAQFGALFAGLDWRKVKALETRRPECAE